MRKVLILGSCLCVWPAVVLAQPAASSIDEVVVTAQKRTERLSDAPLTLSVVTAEDLSARDIHDVGDLQKVVPGFVFTPSAYDAPVYSLRGVGFFNEALGATPAVSVYQDEVPLPFSAMAEGAALDASRVEVLKGPQGVLFGQNASGGAVNFIPVQPTAEPHAGGSLTYGRFNTVEGEAYASGSLSEAIQARLAIRGERGDGFRENDAGPSDGENGQRDFLTARLLTDWRPRDGVKIQVNINGWIDRSDTQARQKIGYAPLNPIASGGYAGSPGYPDLQAQLQAYPVALQDDRAAGFDPGVSLARDDRFWQAAVRSEWALRGGATLTTVGSYARLIVDRPNDIDGTIYPDIFITVDGHIETWSQEARLSGTAGSGRLKWLAGANIERDIVDDSQQVRMNGTNSGFGDVRFQRLVNLNDQRVWTWAGFGDLDLTLGHGLSAEAGLRYTDRRDSYSGCLADPGGPGGIRDGFAALSSAISGSPTTIPPGACVTLGADGKPVGRVLRDLDQDNVSFRGALSWQPGQGPLFYASVTRGYKAGSFDTLPAISPSQLNPVGQEQVVAYEVGGRWTSRQLNLQASAAAFHYDYDHKQIAGYVDTGAPFGLLPALVSVPHSSVEGAEAETHWRPVRGLKINAGAAYLETTVRGRFMTSSPLGGTIDIGGDAFPNAPKWQAEADTEYSFGIGGGRDAFVGGGVSYRSATESAFGGGPLFKIRGAAIVDLRGGVEASDGRWRLELWGKNVGNVYYWTAVQHVEDTVTRSAGLPATWGVTLSLWR